MWLPSGLRENLGHDPPFQSLEAEADQDGGTFVLMGSCSVRVFLMTSSGVPYGLFN